VHHDDFEADVQRLVRSRKSQALKPKCSDPATMARIAAALTGHEPKRRLRRRVAA